MPELPDVEVFRRRLARREGHRVEAVEVHPSRVHKVPEDALRDRLEGARLGPPARHGKWLLAPVDGGAVAMHFGMTGDLVDLGRDRREPKASRLLLRLDDGDRLAYACTRELGRIELAHDLDDLRRTHDLGPDAEGLDERAFAGLLREHAGMVKAVLVDQSVVAGLGNAYADEALFQARIHPRARLADLSDGDLRRLHGALRRVLDWALGPGADEAAERHRGGVRRRDAPPTWLLSHHREGEACPRCGAPLVEAPAGGRRGWTCEACAPLPP